MEEFSFWHLLSSVVIAFLTSLFTVLFSLGKFRAEKIWEQKLEAYKKIIEWLYHQKEYWIVSENDALQIQPLNEEEKNQWNKRLKDSEEELFKMRDIGGLIISDSAVQILNKYYNNVHNALGKDYFEYSDNLFNIAENCLVDFVNQAKRDLAVKLFIFRS